MIEFCFAKTFSFGNSLSYPSPLFLFLSLFIDQSVWFLFLLVLSRSNHQLLVLSRSNHQFPSFLHHLSNSVLPWSSCICMFFSILSICVFLSVASSSSSSFPPLFDFTCVLCLLLQVFCLVIVAFVSPVLSSPICLLLALYVLFISCRSISVAGLLCVFLVSIILCVSVVIRAFASCFSVLHVFCLFHVCESVCLFVHLLNFCLWLCCLPDDFCVCVLWMYVSNSVFMLIY